MKDPFTMEFVMDLAIEDFESQQYKNKNAICDLCKKP